MLTGAGLDQVWHHSRAHRMFTNARWSGDALGLVLADLIVARLLPVGAVLTIAVDDTLFKRSGKKVFGVAWHWIRARWYTTKTEPSYDEMTVKLRRVIIAARSRSPCPEQATPQTRAVLAAWAAAGT